MSDPIGPALRCLSNTLSTDEQRRAAEAVLRDHMPGWCAMAHRLGQTTEARNG